MKHALRALVVAVAVAVLAPAAASAATINSSDWTLKTSWVNYVTNPLWVTGSISAPTWTTSDGYTYVVPVSSTSTDVQEHSGGIRFQVPAHGIDVEFEDLVVTRVDSDTAVVNAVTSFDPIVGSNVVDDPRDILTLDLSAVTPSTSGGVTTYTDAPAYLTADGAEAFNGGSNGAYSADQLWGDFSVAFDD
jgi:hypothetical protein